MRIIMGNIAFIIATFSAINIILLNRLFPSVFLTQFYNDIFYNFKKRKMNYEKMRKIML